MNAVRRDKVSNCPEIDGMAEKFEVYLVGGAVRDELLHRRVGVGDKDFVVVGATPRQMLAAGYKPVGADFPVFLHPLTHEEYALARTEKKSGRGYKGFVFYADPQVSLADDLARRDLTINAMARDADGNLIDLYGGVLDIKNKILRHVSPAFAEDPVRILRAARFAAMLPDFSVAPDTMELMRRMTGDGEVSHLTCERVWRELRRGLTAQKPSRMVETLDECGALAVLLPAVAALKNVPERLDYHPEGDSYTHTLMVLDTAARRGLNEGECFAAMMHDAGKALTPPHILPSHHGHEERGARLARECCARLQPPREVAQLAQLTAAEHGNVHKCLEMRASTMADLLQRLDAYRRPQRFESVLKVCECDFYYWPARRDEPYPQSAFMRQARAAALEVDAKAIAESARSKGGDGKKIAEKIRLARIEKVRRLRRESRADEIER